MPQSSSPFNAPSTPKSAHALSPFGKNSQNAATLIGKGIPPPPAMSGKKGKPNSTSPSPRSSPAPKASGSSSPYSQRIPSLASAAIYSVPESPLLPREAETTFHRKLRTLLQQYTAQAEAWEEVATYDGLKWAKQALESWGDLESAKTLGSRANSSGPRVRTSKAQTKQLAKEGDSLLSGHDPIVGPGGLGEKRMAEALTAIERAETGLMDVVTRLEKHLLKITLASDAISALLLEAAKARGVEFAFQEPMWGTWTMDRFVSYITAVTPTYVLSTSHLALLVPILIRPKAFATLTLARISKSTFAPESKLSDDPNAHRRKAFEEWIALPYLETKGRGSISYLESICQVEVARYKEQP